MSIAHFCAYSNYCNADYKAILLVCVRFCLTFHSFCAILLNVKDKRCTAFLSITDIPFSPRPHAALAVLRNPLDVVTSLCYTELMDVGKWIKEERQKRGWSQRQLAAFVLVHPNTIANWERGNTVPGALYLKQLRRVFRSHPAKEETREMETKRRPRR